MQVLEATVRGRLAKQIAIDIGVSVWKVNRARMLLGDKIGSRDRDVWFQVAVRFGLVPA
jgi:FixJ family two-component response regulator